MKTGHDLVVEAKARIVEVPCAVAWQDIQQGALVVDVREADEFALSHVPGALHLPRGLLEFKAPALLPDDGRPMRVYCKTSGRAALAVDVLQVMGYANVASIAGGFDAWLESGLPVESPAPVDFD